LHRLIALTMAISTSLFAITLKKEAERKRAPDFELKDSAGKAVRLSDYAGKVVLLDFWATWCAPCKSSIPWFNELSARYGAEGFTVLGVSMDEDGWAAVKPFMEKVPVNYAVVIGNPRVAYLYGDVKDLPIAFFLDRNQRVAAIHAGAAGKKDFEKTIRSLLAAAR